VLAVLVGILLQRSQGKKSAPPSEPPEETRWSRFVIHAAAIEKGAVGEDVVTQVPKGLKWPLVGGASSTPPRYIGGDSKVPLVRLERKRLAWKPVFVLRLENRPWLELAPRDGGKFPELREPKKGNQSRGPRLKDLSLQGSLGRREYEIRIAGKLVVSASQQVEDGETIDGSYYVEILKSAQPLPFLALTLALEHFASLQGRPASTVLKSA
ncbi:MAG: hypothetical protein AAF517_09250, partial [Planctomycetota bacterium]